MTIPSRALAGLSLALLACGAPDAASRERALASLPARHLVGVWDVSFLADSMSTAIRLRGSARVVTGTIALTLNHSGADADEALRGITHEGAYDVDFAPLGFSTRLADAAPVAVARVQTTPSGDSLWIVLSPGSEQFPLRMLGVLRGDTARGTWSAAAFSAGGGTGRFVMRRQAAQP